MSLKKFPFSHFPTVVLGLLCIMTTIVSPKACLAIPVTGLDSLLNVEDLIPPEELSDSFDFKEVLVPPETKILNKVMDYAKEGKYDDSIRLLEQYLTENPDSAVGHEILGVILAVRGNLDGALPQLRKAAEIDPKQGRFHTRIGDVLLAKNDLAGSRDAFQKAIALNSRDRKAHQRLGILYEREGKDDQAIHHYEQGIKGTPADYVGIKVNLGRLYNSRQEYSKTKELLENIVPPKSSTNVIGLIVLGTAHLYLGQTDNALSCFKRAAAIDPVKGSVPLGIAYRAKGLYEDSLKELHKAQDTEFNKSIIYFQQAETLLAMKKYQEAEEKYRAASAQGYDALTSLRGVARAQIAQQKLAAAASTLEKILAHKNAVPYDYFQLSDVYKFNNSLQKAETVLTDAKEKYPDDPRVFYQLGIFYGYIKKYPESLQALNKALSLSGKDDVSILKALSIAHNRNGERKKAIQFAEKIHELQPENIESTFYLASLYQDNSNNIKAANLYEKILNTQPDHAFSLNNLAVLMLNQKDYSKALELSQKAASLEPENALILDTLGWSQAKAGQNDAALKTLLTAEKKSPNVPVILYHIGEAYYARNEIPAAREYLEKALSLSENFSGAVDARKKLDTM